MAEVEESLASVLDGEVNCGVVKSGHFRLIVDEATEITV